MRVKEGSPCQRLHQVIKETTPLEPASVFLGLIMSVDHPEWAVAIVADGRRQGLASMDKSGRKAAEVVVRKVPVAVIV